MLSACSPSTRSCPCQYTSCHRRLTREANLCAGLAHGKASRRAKRDDGSSDAGAAGHPPLSEELVEAMDPPVPVVDLAVFPLELAKLPAADAVLCRGTDQVSVCLPDRMCVQLVDKGRGERT